MEGVIDSWAQPLSRSTYLAADLPDDYPETVARHKAPKATQLKQSLMARYYFFTNLGNQLPREI